MKSNSRVRFYNSEQLSFDDVLFINAPWHDIRSPSIQLSILKPIIAQLGLKTKTLYANLILLKYIPLKVYDRMFKSKPLMFLGERLFSDYAFGESFTRKPVKDYLEYINASFIDYLERTYESKDNDKATTTYLDRAFGKNYQEIISDLMNESIPSYMNELKRIIEKSRARIYAFSTTFNQNIPSFAISRLIKEIYPHSIIIFGGDNCEGVMGRAIMNTCKYVDYVISGEGEESLPALVKSVLKEDENEIRNIRGLLYRHDDKVASNEPSPLIRDLNVYPTMDCDDYFRQLLTISPELNLDSIDIKIEFSRGCWWGQNSQCTFCGLNGLGISYRSKSPEKALSDLLTISKKYRTVDFTVTDNILNQAYVTTMLKRLSKMEIELNLFFEVKAALSKRQILIMSNAGVRLVQPGIESLSSHVLKLMRKGSTMLQNIQTLKWLKEFYIQPLWNILYGFPGEKEDDFLIQERVLPHIFHLTPPGGISNIEMHRFSPNFDFRDEFGFEQITPLKDYSYIYPNNIKDIEEIAYYFDYDKHYQRKFTVYVRKINSLISEWKTKKRSANPPYLNYRSGPEFLKIYDNRNGKKIELTYTGIEKEIILICDKVRSFKELSEMTHRKSSYFELDDAIRTLLERGILLEEDGNYLSLPVRLVPKLEV